MFQLQKLFKLMIDRNIKKKELREMSGVSATSIAKLGKGANVNTEVLLKICDALNCDVGDIMEFVPDDEHTDALIQQQKTDKNQVRSELNR